MIRRSALLCSAMLVVASAATAASARVYVVLDDAPISTAPPAFSPGRIAALAQAPDVGLHASPASDILPASAADAADGEPPQADPPAPVAAGPAVGAEAPSATTQRDINPFDRDINITVPLTFNRRVLGELDVVLTRDDRFEMNAEGFRQLISPLLTDAAREEIAAALAGRESFEANDIAAAGVVLDYDPTALSILVVRIDPARRLPQSLFQTGSGEEPGEPPRPFSAYLNADVVVSREQSTGHVKQPSVFLGSAVRFGDVVLEADAFGRESFTTGEYEADRRYARLVYDQREKFRRWYLGDMDPEFRGRQGYVQLGGAGVIRRRDRFNDFRHSVLRGDRQLLLQSESTVRVLRNGALVREFRLDPGQYDLSNLPLQTGSNDFEIEVRDQSGVVQTLRYSGYLDAIDLEPGDYEYGAYLGVTARPSFGAPDYSEGDLAFTGFWRKAFIDKPGVGVGLQLSETVQAANGQSQFILRNGGRVIFDAAVSRSDVVGEGFSGAVRYDFLFDRGVMADNAAIQVDYVSQNYSVLGDPAAVNSREWSVSAQYSRIFSDRLNGTLSASYNTSRFDLGDSYRANAYATYRFSREWSVQGGVSYVEYPRSEADRSGGGFFMSLVWQPVPNRRADVRYDSTFNAASASYVKSPSNLVGSVGYSALVTYNDGPSSASGSVSYVANRFDADLSHVAYGRDFNTIGDEQVTSLRVGSAIAFTGGKVAVGRRISDSFAIVSAHPTLDDRKVIVGQVLQGGRYAGSSGLLGPALSSQLGSYLNQSVQYDVEDLPAGYDIGEGVRRVYPHYKSGFAFEVGTNAFVSAVGTLVGQNGKAVQLIGGRITPADDPAAESLPFFTNSVGRFAIQGLEPGKAYRVQVFTDPRVAFQFTVPAENEGLLNLQTVTVPMTVE